jgi:hypothetical protein
MPIPPYLTSFLEVLKILSFCGLYRGIFSGIKLYFSCHSVVCRSLMCSLLHYVLNVIPFCMQVFFPCIFASSLFLQKVCSIGVCWYPLFMFCCCLLMFLFCVMLVHFYVLLVLISTFIVFY